jgi:hypothetical protein
MNKLLLIATLLFAPLLAPFLAPSPVAAQAATSSGQQGQSTSNGQQSNGQAGKSGGSRASTTGVICSEDMTATFCNVVTGPNNGGYGSSGGSASGSGAGNTASSIPHCSTFPPANELCD